MARVVEQSINSFIELHAALIQRLARKATRPPLLSDDVAQEVMAALLRWHRNGAFAPEKVENPEAYLRVVIRNAVSRAARRARVESPAQPREPKELEGDLSAGSSPPPYQSTFADQALEARALLDRLKASLAPRDALAFALLVEDEMTVDQVAASLGTTPNNIYQIRHRIRCRARELLDASRERG